MCDNEGGAIPPGLPTMRHVARHDPAAVLRRCAADRKLLDWLLDCENKAREGDWWNLDVGDALAALAEAYGVEV